ncbi:PREDICTED: erythroid membrane-associated protein-like [Odobenus rosmarus divergens]|uniref:Erythroid membrane-associated protein-like n=1 Tax=Odobenus rosmarus divergens TaxID=9708 RepID=A0A2U3WZF5_ODORO|nr:PREDICTED: erythroid membrane-associated protein-like [Odobenus rosmarus divergens]
MDSEVQRDGRILDLIDDAWREDKLPYEDVAIPQNELPEPEQDNGGTTESVKEQEMKWTDLAFQYLHENFFECELRIFEDFPDLFIKWLQLTNSVSLVYLFTHQMVTIMPVTVSVLIPLFSKLLPGQFHVIGPRAPVIALVGEEAVLSCQISPSMDAQNMEVRWYRNDPLGLVHRYGTSWNDMEELRPEYQGRTEFLKENITKGHVALRIHPIQPSDGGDYACFFESSTYYNDAKFQVLVTVLEAGKPKVKALADLVSESPLPGKLHAELGLQFARQHAENVTLDPETAHPYLEVAKDKKSVKSIGYFQELPKSSNRFDSLVSVLGQQIFSTGKHYWEVDVKNKMKWTVGICKHSVLKQGEIIVSPETGFWTLCLKKCNDYQALTNPRITLHLEEPPEIIGIFLDYEAGRLSFYNVTHLTHIYTYKQKFTEALQPYFYPGPLYNGQNEQPLTIIH